MNILVIAGHGGNPYDPGACGCGYKEAVETRRLATAVAPLLRAYGFNVTMYDQNNDAYKVLYNGGSLPLSGINYVLEIHLNAGVSDENGNGTTTGTEVLVHSAESGVTVEQAICRRIAALGFKNRGVRRRSDLLVMNTVHRKGISHALVETCFIDDADDMKLYKEKFYDIAHAIADGIAEGFGKAVNDMTEAQVKQIATQVANDVVSKSRELYETIDEVPDWARQTVEKLVRKGFIVGNDDQGSLGLTWDAMRVFVANDRAHLYGE